MSSDRVDGAASEIRFGSDGFRGFIADGFTFATVSRILSAVRRHLDSIGARPDVIVGYDRRFVADVFAHNLAALWESAGGTARVSKTALTSPLLAWQTRKRHASMGLMVTASHNPPEHLGLKLKEPFGGSAHPDVQRKVAEIASAAGETSAGFEPLYRHTRLFDPIEGYKAAICAAFPLFDNPNGKARLAVDFMHGSAADIAPGIFAHLKIGFTGLREDRDPTFGGIGPEPAPARLDGLRGFVRKNAGQVLGIAFDGDGDRLAVIDEDGEFLGNHELYALYLRHLVTRRGERGRAVGTVSHSRLLNRVASDVGVELVRVPVGFKQVSAEFAKGGVIIGGEESGGCGFGFWLPDRDALVMALLLLEILAAEGKTLVGLRKDLVGKYGPMSFGRRDMRLKFPVDYSALDELLGREKPAFGGLEAASMSDADGRLLHLAGGAWILARLSGTEPMIRLYAESSLPTLTEAILDDMEKLLAHLAE